MPGQETATEGARRVSIALQSAPSEPRHGFDRISVRRLVLIRWVAIAGQAVTLLVVYHGFGFAVPLAPAFAVVFCSVLLNLGITLVLAGEGAASANFKPLCSSATICCSSALCST